MIRVLTGIVLVALVMLVLFKAPVWLFCVAVGVIAMLATYEYLRLVAAHELQPLITLTMIAVALQFFYSYLGIKLRTTRTPPSATHGWRILQEPIYQYQILTILIGIVPFVLLVVAMRKRELRQALPSVACSYFALPYIALTLSYLVLLRALMPNGALAIFYLFAVVWSGDIFAYYVGRFAGRHPMAPRISPKKTWEGALASLVASSLVGTLLLVYNGQVASFAEQHGLLPRQSVFFGAPHSEPNILWLAILITISINIAAQLGDLVESMIKRGASVKDSGEILPGHGGVFDRIDALLLAMPVLWYYASSGLIHF